MARCASVENLLAIKVITHLTFVGSAAGSPYCGESRNSTDKYVHGMFAPLHSKEFRVTACKSCLAQYLDSFDADESLPEWADELRPMQLGLFTGEKE
jgi:hypothetical protein